MADRSTAAVGVANEGGETQPVAQQGDATSDGTTTDDQTGSTPEDLAAEDAPTEQRTTTKAAGARTSGVKKDAGRRTARPGAKQPLPPAVAAAAAEPAETSDTGVPTDDEGPKQPPAGPPQGPDGPASPAGPKDKDTAAAVDAATDVLPVTPAGSPAGRSKPARPSTAPDLHSGHKLARRYQLAECVTRVDGFSSWRAVDEKLRRAVGIHLLPADHKQARTVLAAARSAALLGDPRFVQVLDAVEEDNLVYVIHEWLPDATSMADLLSAGPLEPHEAYQMVSQVSQGMAAAHREGLAHLRLDPGAVLRTVSGQYRIRGLAVAAALRGLSSERPQQQDTEAIGALLYASLTQRWPYEEDAHGLLGLPKGVGLVAPDQVRAGVHRGLSEVAMRALANDGATASREESPCTTPEELAKAVAGVPRIRPPENPPPVFRPTAFQQPAPPSHSTVGIPVAASVPPPALPGRTGKALKWAVTALVIVAIGLGSWQLADALQSHGGQAAPAPTANTKTDQSPTAPPPAVPIKIADAKEFAAVGDLQDAKDVKHTYDDSDSTYWRTKSFVQGPALQIKPGVGIIYDLGSARTVRSASISFRYSGDHTTVELLATDSLTPSTDLSGMTKLATAQTTGDKVTVSATGSTKSRYVLVWLTALPHSGADQFSQAGYKQAITNISFTG